eukprot:CAMPEP_0176172022 /NCGR_PEP_ID=MMETSP0120_2-20121206/88108_1 /TAXON_ID=160619 /ORGANISM="Kryptoperidinium foliaceum, Strain CCMP 1326" /LENGTH=33 /DNA_ID= /DNA_START= /DNA_END= /DNA_ORIENTATION=
MSLEPFSSVAFSRQQAGCILRRRRPPVEGTAEL